MHLRAHGALSLKDATREEEEGEEKKNPHTQVASRTRAAAAHALCAAESGEQIEDQHHLEVTAPHCPVSVRNASALDGASLLLEDFALQLKGRI